MTSHGTVFSRATESRHAGDDKSWVAFQQDFRWGETETFQNAGAVRVNEDVSGGYQ